MIKCGMVACYSESHKYLYERYFLPSFNRYLKDEIDLCPIEIPQIGDGIYQNPGWKGAMIYKLSEIINYLKCTDYEYVICSDVDIQFFGPIADVLISELGDKDIAFQDDLIEHCAGFYICKNNRHSISILESALTLLKLRNGEKSSEQKAINDVINKSENVRKLSYRFWTARMATVTNVWKSEPFACPRDILMHHANWCMRDKKEALLQKVRTAVNGDIPKIIHQIWMGSPPHKIVRQWQEKLVALHPGWEYKFWNDRNLNAVAKPHYFKDDFSNPIKSDILRYHILREYGGVYLDSDMEPQYPLDLVIKKHHSFICSEQGSKWYSNAFIGSAPGHSLLDKIIDGLEESINDPNNIYPCWKSGPTYISKILNRHGIAISDPSQNDCETVIALPSAYFYPYRWDELHKAKEAYPLACCIHRWNAVTHVAS